jgi:hypothetical protein
MCGALADVCFVPKADMDSISDLDCYNVVNCYRSANAFECKIAHRFNCSNGDKPGPGDMGSTMEITASPKLRSMFGVAAVIMLALWGWSLVPPIENWGNPNEDGFSYVPVFYTTIVCLPAGIYLLVGAIAGHGRYVRRARIAFFIAAGITTAGGIMRPSALTVLRLITSSYFVGA